MSESGFILSRILCQHAAEVANQYQGANKDAAFGLKVGSTLFPVEFSRRD